MKKALTFLCIMPLWVCAQNTNQAVDSPMLKAQLNTVAIIGKQELNLKGLQNATGGMYLVGKKIDWININTINANVVQQNARQVFAKVAGINVQENEGSGQQIAIAARGLSPNRSWEFNVRQNGIDIAADNLGYSEAYYTPVLQGVAGIAVVRGSAGLQYGAQMGGMVNYVMKDHDTCYRLVYEGALTTGSFGLKDTYHSLGGKSKKWTFFGFVNYREGNGWRQHNVYQSRNAYFSTQYKVSRNLTLKAQLTYQLFDVQLPGGLTDYLFKVDPRIALRARNFMQNQWIVPSVQATYQLKKATGFFNVFGLIAHRFSIGVTAPITTPDLQLNRDLLKDHYRNIGFENRWVVPIKIAKANTTLSAGVRAYKGTTHRLQGTGENSNLARFGLNSNMANPLSTDFTIPITNFSIFAEHVIFLSPTFSITPGIRAEYLHFESEGKFLTNGSYQPAAITRTNRLALAGMTVQYQPNVNQKWYASINQSFRPVGVGDLRVTTPLQKVDSNLKSASGWQSEIGFKGKVGNLLQMEITGFYLYYKNRIGVVNLIENNVVYQLRTNIANNKNVGIEMNVQTNIIESSKYAKQRHLLQYYINATLMQARYTASDSVRVNDAQLTSWKNKQVEYAPNFMLRTGLQYNINRFSTTLMYSYTGKQFTDALNTATPNATGQLGIVPAYGVIDLSSQYKVGSFSVDFGINNIANVYYFTRRASGYPGPGLLPGEGRSFYISLRYFMNKH